MISQVEEGPPIDTGRFPIPAGFRYLLDATFQKGEFVDLCWDANRVLYRHREELKEHWCALLVQRGLNDKLLFDEVPGKLPRSAIGPLFMSCEMLHVFVPVCFLILFLYAVSFTLLSIGRVQQRLSIPHEVLDTELAGTVKGACATWWKDTMHALGGYLPK